MENLVNRIKRSEDFETLKRFADTEFPGLGDKADLLYTCLSLAGCMAENHPDLEKTPRTVVSLADKLFTDFTKHESPEGKEREDDGTNDSGIST